MEGNEWKNMNGREEGRKEGRKEGKPVLLFPGLEALFQTVSFRLENGKGGRRKEDEHRKAGR
jgi:hypothetical protein